MKNAVDFSFARPSGAELQSKVLDALFYTGNARPDQSYIDDLRAHAVACTFVQETYSARSQEGYQAGVYDAQFADQRVSDRGYPLSAAVAYVVSDGNAYDPNSNGGAIADYGQGIADTSQRPFFFYGNRYAVDNAMAGARRSAGAVRCLGGWVPSTWNPSGDLLVQEANVASPVADTDFNTVYQAYGAWGGDAPAAPTSPARRNQEDTMIYVGPLFGRIGNVAWLCVGEAILKEWSDADGGAALGGPQKMVDWNNQTGHHYDVKTLDADMMQKLLDKQSAPTTASGAPIDIAALAKELAPLLAPLMPHHLSGDLS